MDDDVVRYTVHCFSDDGDLESLLRRCLSAVLAEASSYIWHDGRFCLRADDARGCLAGEVRFGDNVEDEWFVVALLRKITEEVEGAVARVEDGDGEVLLIEAADALPGWAQEPEAARGRAFLHRGRVHLVPMASRPSDLTPFPGLMSGEPAVECFARAVANPVFRTEASQAVQKTVADRLGKRPGDWSDNLHYVHALLPAKAAQMLHRSPQLISTVLQRFLTLDKRDVKAWRGMEHFRQEDCVETGVEMTRCLYALALSKDIWPSKESKWTLPRKETEEWKEKSMGFKISACMEVLLADIGKTGTDESQGFEAYLKRLQKVGYFGDLLPGSKKYSALLDSARYAYSENNGSSEQDPKLIEFHECYQRADDAKDDEKRYRHAKLERPPDDDAWLYHDQESLDKMLKQHFHIGESEEQAVMEKLENFLSKESDMKGVELDELDRPLDIDMDGLQASLGKLMREMEGGQMESDEEDLDDDEEEDEERAINSEMEKELLSSNVKDGEELVQSIKNLRKEFAEASSGPATTLLQTLKK